MIWQALTRFSKWSIFFYLDWIFISQYVLDGQDFEEKNLEHFLLKIVSVTLSTSMSNFMSANLFFVGRSAGRFLGKTIKKAPCRMK